jgi:hypothetical protein
MSAVTIDLHPGDYPSDIETASELLTNLGIRATFFLPTSMLLESAIRAVLRPLLICGHEIGTHGHWHDSNEINALRSSKKESLDFLRSSTNAYQDCFGIAPSSFRSPCWCALGNHAVDRLQELGYRVDSSATPQRLPILSSRPFRNSWSFVSRSPYWLRDELLEIPTTSLLVPLGSPTFLTLRRRGSSAMLKLLLFEARCNAKIVVNAQFHVDDLRPASCRIRPRPTVRPSDFVPWPRGGLAFRYQLRERREVEIWKTSFSLLSLLRRTRCLTVSEIRHEIVRARGRKETELGQDFRR